MALVPHKITALAESDADGTDGKNIIAGAVVSLFDSSGAAVTLFDDENGSNGSTTKQTDSSGQVVVWVTPGEYTESVNGSAQRAVTIGGNNLTSYADSEALQASRPTNTGARSESRNNGAIYTLSASGYSAQVGDKIASNGRVWKLDTSNGIKLSHFDSLSEAKERAALDSVADIQVESSTLTISSSIDMQGVGIIGNGTVINDTSNLKNVGRIRNCKVRGYDVDYDNISPVAALGGKSTKVILRESSQQAHVFTKKAGKGYMMFSHFYNSFTSGATDTGLACESWRSTVTKNASEVYLLKREADDETASAWSAFTNATLSTTFPSGTVDGRQLQYRSTNTLNAEIAWDYEAESVGQIGYIAVYRSGGSATSVELTVNGELQKTFSAQVGSGNDIMLVKYESTLMGTNEVRLKKVAAGSLNVFGAEFTTLSKAESFRSYDYVAYGEWPEEYVSGSSASDYAFFSSGEQKWFGSIHGGETERSPAIFYVDGSTYSVPAVGDFLVGSTIRVDQKTTMATGSDSLDVDSSYTYETDSVQLLDVSMSGSATLKTAYTTMSPTNDAFSRVEYPRKIDVQTGKNLMGRHNKIVQVNRSNPTYPLRLTTYMTLFPMGGDKGANMTANGPYVSGVSGTYNKVYYGPVTDSEVTITSLAFSNVKVFE